MVKEEAESGEIVGLAERQFRNSAKKELGGECVERTKEAKRCRGLCHVGSARTAPDHIGSEEVN